MSEEYKTQLKKLQQYIPLVKKEIEQIKNETNCLSKLRNMQAIHDGLLSNNNRLSFKELSQYEKILKEHFDQHLNKDVSSRKRQNNSKMVEYVSTKGITIAKLQSNNFKDTILTEDILILSDSDCEEAENNQSSLEKGKSADKCNSEESYVDKEEESLLVPLKTVPSMEYEKRSHLSYYTPHVNKNHKDRLGLHKNAEINKIYSNGKSNSNNNRVNNVKKKSIANCETIEIISDSDESVGDTRKKTNKSSSAFGNVPTLANFKSLNPKLNGKITQPIKATLVEKSSKIPMTSSKNFLSYVNLKSTETLRESIESGKLSITAIEKLDPLGTYSSSNSNRKRKSRAPQKKNDLEKDQEYMPNSELALTNVQPGAKRWSLRKVRPQKIEDGFAYNEKDFDFMETDSTPSCNSNASDQNGSPASIQGKSKAIGENPNGSINRPPQLKENSQQTNVYESSDPKCIEIIDDDDNDKINTPKILMNVSTNSELLSSTQKTEIPKNINILHHIQSNFVNYCILCEMYQNQIVNHYVNVHPNSEVFISRLPQDIVANIGSIDILGFIDNFNPKHLIYSANCVFCDKEYKYLFPFWYHHFTMHTGEFSFECSGCGIKKPTGNQLKNHIENECTSKGSQMKTLHLFDTESLKIEASICKICNYVQLNPKNIIKHLCTQHGFKTNLSSKIKTVTILKICGQYQGGSTSSYNLPESNY